MDNWKLGEEEDKLFKDNNESTKGFSIGKIDNPALEVNLSFVISNLKGNKDCCIIVNNPPYFFL